MLDSNSLIKSKLIVLVFICYIRIKQTFQTIYKLVLIFIWFSNQEKVFYFFFSIKNFNFLREICLLYFKYFDKVDYFIRMEIDLKDCRKTKVVVKIIVGVQRN